MDRKGGRCTSNPTCSWMRVSIGWKADKRLTQSTAGRAVSAEQTVRADGWSSTNQDDSTYIRSRQASKMM